MRESGDPCVKLDLYQKQRFHFEQKGDGDMSAPVEPAPRPPFSLKLSIAEIETSRQNLAFRLGPRPWEAPEP